MPKKINEENLVVVQKKIKRIPIVPRRDNLNYCLTKRELLKLIENLSDDTLIVTAHRADHTFETTQATIETAICKNKSIFEDWGQETYGGTRKQVVVIM